jgi:hypothetical protein
MMPEHDGMDGIRGVAQMYRAQHPSMIPTWDVKARYRLSLLFTLGMLLGSLAANILLVTPARAVVARLLGIGRR